MRSGVQVTLSLLNNQPLMEKSVSGFLFCARFTLGFDTNLSLNKSPNTLMTYKVRYQEEEEHKAEQDHSDFTLF